MPAGPAQPPDSRDASDPALRALDDPCAGSLLDYRVNTSVTRGGKRGPRASEAKVSRTPWRSAARRAGPRHGPAVPSDEGTGPTARRPRVRRSAPALCGALLPSQEGEQQGRDFAKPGRIPSRQREPISARPLRAPVHAVRRTPCHLEPGPKPPPCRSPCETLSSAGGRSCACATSAICCNSGVAAGTRRAVASGLASAMHMPASTAALPRCPRRTRNGCAARSWRRSREPGEPGPEESSFAGSTRRSPLHAVQSRWSCGIWRHGCKACSLPWGRRPALPPCRRSKANRGGKPALRPRLVATVAPRAGAKPENNLNRPGMTSHEDESELVEWSPMIGSSVDPLHAAALPSSPGPADRAPPSRPRGPPGAGPVPSTRPRPPVTNKDV